VEAGKFVRCRADECEALRGIEANTKSQKVRRFEPPNHQSQLHNSDRDAKSASSSATKSDTSDAEKKRLLGILSKIWHKLTREQKSTIQSLASGFKNNLGKPPHYKI
jgi:hypothetical protein